MKNMDYISFNASIWDNINECLTDKSTAISHEEYIAAKNGALDVTLAGIKKVPREWFPKLAGADVLGLASGGGQQMFRSTSLQMRNMSQSGRIIKLTSSVRIWQSPCRFRTIPLI